MIVINLKNLADFGVFLEEARLSDHVFYEVVTDSHDHDERRVIYFSFLGMINNLTILFQFMKRVPGTVAVPDVVNEISQDVAIPGLRFIEGTLREVYLSIS